MRKKLAVLILAGSMIFGVSGCENERSAQIDETVNTEKKTETVATTESSDEKEKEYLENTETIDNSGNTENAEDSKEQSFSLADLSTTEFCFCSGAGAWQTTLNINADGSFSGQYSDSNMGDTGDGYPGGIVYLCAFTGQFSQPKKINDYTYAVQIEKLDYEKEVNTEEIIDDRRFIYSNAYGLDDAKELFIYLPGAPLAEFSEEFKSWIKTYSDSFAEETNLPFYALHNKVHDYGFYSQDIVEALTKSMSLWKESAAGLEAEIQEGSLSQMEYNEKTEELYRIWDCALNEVWNVLKRIMTPEEMEALTKEEREWITMKERISADAGAEFEGGSMQQMAINNKAAELTKERAYELYKLVEKETE
ncbi:MAG: DUF1311 domain-containing protein [Lachnospiraceae bacterium]|jgi:uncharacterized protein YecT (DUF1311 family)|nr:DUF1311 domain-containing protein [Lachnospiraceae bacterium]